MRSPAWLGLLIASFASVVAIAQRQGPVPSFRSGIGLVQIDVSVADGRHQPIRGLQAADFTVLEDGKPRPIRVFESVDLATIAARPEVPPAADSSAGVATNQTGNQNGRLVFILMDRTIPVGHPVVAAKKVAAAAINALGPSDLAAIITTGGNVPQTLTTDRARLLHALDQGDWSTGLSPEQEEIVGKYDPFSDGRCQCGLCVLETVTNIAEAAREAPRRRKLLLFIGNSIIVQAGARAPSADIGCGNRVRDAREKMEHALALSHLTVDSIDPAGLASSMYEGSGNGKQDQNGPVARRQKLNDDTTQRLQDQGSLEVLPSLTGGRTFTNTNAPERAVPDIFHESSAYYLIGYEPAAGGQDAKRRSIDVKVARADAHVATIKAALPPGPSPPLAAPNGGTRSPLDLALAGLLPDARVPLEMSTAAFASANGSKAYVDVRVNASAFESAPRRSFDLAVVVRDQRGRQVAWARDGGLTPQPSGNLRTHVVLPPGDYELRMAIEARDTGMTSSIFSQLTIPAFAGTPLSMSDLVVGTRDNPEPPPDPDAPDIPIIPTTGRTFHRRDVAWAFAHVYESAASNDPIEAVKIRTTVTDVSGRTVRDESATMGEEKFVGRHVGLRIRVPVDTLPPGKYVLRVEATRGSRTAARSVTYTIE